MSRPATIINEYTKLDAYGSIINSIAWRLRMQQFLLNPNIGRLKQQQGLPHVHTTCKWENLEQWSSVSWRRACWVHASREWETWSNGFISAGGELVGCMPLGNWRMWSSGPLSDGEEPAGCILPGKGRTWNIGPQSAGGEPAGSCLLGMREHGAMLLFL